MLCLDLNRTICLNTNIKEESCILHSYLGPNWARILIGRSGYKFKIWVTLGEPDSPIASSPPQLNCLTNYSKLWNDLTNHPCFKKFKVQTLYQPTRPGHLHDKRERREREETQLLTRLHLISSLPLCSPPPPLPSVPFSASSIDARCGSTGRCCFSLWSLLFLSAFMAPYVSILSEMSLIVIVYF